MPVTMLSYPLDTSKSSNRLGNLIVLVGLGVAICLMAERVMMKNLALRFHVLHLIDLSLSLSS